MWQGTQILPSAWVEEATASQVPNGPSANTDWVQGYGYQFWRCRHGAYRGDGAFGQFCVVMPEQQAVLAITSGVRNMQRILDLVWDLLLPAMAPAPLPANAAGAEALGQRLSNLRLAPPQGMPDALVAARVTGRVFTVAENGDGIAALRFDFDGHGCRLTLRTEQGEHTVSCGYGEWRRGETSFGRAARRRMPVTDGPPAKIAACGAWTDEQTYVAQLWWYETPFSRTLTCRFSDDGVTVQQQPNVSWVSAELPTLEGRLA